MLYVVTALDAERNATDRVACEKAHDNAGAPLIPSALVLQFRSLLLMAIRAFDFEGCPAAKQSRHPDESSLLLGNQYFIVLVIDNIFIS